MAYGSDKGSVQCWGGRPVYPVPSPLFSASIPELSTPAKSAGKWMDFTFQTIGHMCFAPPSFFKAVISTSQTRGTGFSRAQLLPSHLVQDKV